MTYDRDPLALPPLPAAPAAPATQRAVSTALEEWEAALGKPHVLADEDSVRLHEANVTAFSRTIRAILRPASTFEVQELVRIARRSRVPLYPVSTGKNWGLGSRLPVESGAVLVDLGRMDAIRDLNGEDLYATVEPGVTQRQLYAAVEERGLPVRINVTGSSADTSLIGNAMERGIGYLGLRVDETWNLEVVLGTGEILRTGFGHVTDSCLGPLYRHGIGPSLDGLFFQSNFGIVTAATVALYPVPSRHCAAVVSIDSDSDFPALVDAIAWARRAGCFDGVIHIGDRSRTRITMAPLVSAALQRRGGLSPSSAHRVALDILSRQGFGAWSALIGLSGTAGHVRDALRALRGRVRPFGRVRMIDDRRLWWARAILAMLRPFAAARRAEALLEAVTPLYGLTRGVPSDAAVASVGFAASQPLSSANPDHGDAGMLYCLPLMPLSGAAARESLVAIRAMGAKYEIETSVTFNVIDVRVLEAVVTIPFHRGDASAAQRARDCSDELRGVFSKRGFTPYRVDISAMAEVVDPEDLFWQKALALKDLLDPDRIIARGRYNLA